MVDVGEILCEDFKQVITAYLLSFSGKLAQP